MTSPGRTSFNTVHCPSASTPGTCSTIEGCHASRAVWRDAVCRMSHLCYSRAFNACCYQRCVAHTVCSGIADPPVCSPEERSIDHAVLLVRCVRVLNTDCVSLHVMMPRRVAACASAIEPPRSRSRQTSQGWDWTSGTVLPCAPALPFR